MHMFWEYIFFWSYHFFWESVAMEFYGILSVLTKDIRVQYMITDYYSVEAKIKLKYVFFILKESHLYISNNKKKF